MAESNQISVIRNQKSVISRFAVLLIVLAGIAAYANSFSDAFVFDDIDSIVSYAGIRSLCPPWKFFTSLSRPILNLSLAVNYAIGGLNVVSYHAFNIAVHVLAALTLFGLVRRTLMLPALKARFEGAATGIALATALIWEVHPLQTESVTYIIQRAESLAGLFYLLTLYCLLRAASSSVNHQDTKTPRKELRIGNCQLAIANSVLGALVSWWSKGGWHMTAVLACAMGMGTKETVATAPLVALLYDRLFLAGSFREALRRRWVLYVALAATWLLLIPTLAAPHDVQHGSAGFRMAGITPMSYAATQFGVILHYLRLSFWPAGLCLDYQWPVAKELARILPGAIVVGALVAATVAALILRPAWGFLGAWFFLILAPTSSFMPIADVAVEHRMYLPLAAVAAFVVIGGWLLLGRLGGNRGPAQIWAAAAVFLCFAALAGLTVLRNLDYRSELSIWNDTCRKAPNNPRAFDGLGKAYFEKHDYERAIAAHAEAIRLNPNYAPAYNGLAIVYNELRQFDSALKCCDKAIRQDPNFPVFHDTRGVILARKGEYEQAIQEYNRAIALSPRNANSYMNRGVAEGKLNRLPEALADFDKAIALNPVYPNAYYNRGNTYADREDYDRAIADYTQAIAMRPDYRDAYFNRAVAWFFKKDYRRSWADIRALRALGAEPSPQFLQALTKAAPPD